MITVMNIEDIAWNKIVKESIVNFTPNYCRAFKEHGDGEPVLFYLEKNKSIAYQVMFKRKIDTSLGTYYDLISPYGYGGWIMSGEYDSSMYDEYIEYCKNNHIICEFERFDLFRSDISKYYGTIRKVSHNVVKRVDMNDEEIFNDMERRARKNVRKALKNGLSVMIDEDLKYLDEFKQIYYTTMDRNHAEESYYFNDNFFKILTKENSKLFHVFFEDKIISTELVLYDSLCCYSYLGGTLNEYFNLRPNEIMKYEIMRWGHSRGLKYFVLGGGYGSDDGIFVYKKGLAPNGIYNFFVGTKIFDENIYEELCKERGANKETSFFPAYRKGGSK